MTQSPTVAVVDDDDQVRESLATLVQSMNLDVQLFASGREFLDRFVDDRPACIILDLRMPQLNGLEVLQELSLRRMRLPVIMISAHGDIPAAVSAMKIGAIDFLEKPYRGAALMDSVRRAIDLDTRRRQTDSQRDELFGRYESLSDVEKEVMRLTAAGKPDKAIAVKLDLSLRTIQLRRAGIMRKLGVNTRAELIRLTEVLEQMKE